MFEKLLLLPYRMLTTWKGLGILLLLLILWECLDD
jgi:hypothetical protein